MLSLDLNLASRPFKNDTLPWVGLGIAVVSLTLLTIWNVRTYRQNSKWVEDLQQQYSTMREELAQFDRREREAHGEIQDYDLGALIVRADKANEVIRWKAFSWTRLFNLLQEVLPNDVQMVSIRPIFRPQGAQRSRYDETSGLVPVSVEGTARSLSAFLSFERALLAHPSFDRVEPEGHTQSRTGSLAFELRFLYDPAVAEQSSATEVAVAEGSETPGQPGAEQPGAEQPEEGQPDAEQPGAEVAATAANEQAADEPPAVAEAQPATGEAGGEAGVLRSEQSAAQRETSAPTEAGETRKRPKPPGSRRGGKRRTAAGDEQREEAP